MIDRQQQQQSGKVTLEDLLRLKRAERPPAEFWAEFDRTLHAKQLAAIVEKRPWWRRQHSWLSGSRWSLPLGAAAALAVTFATVGHPIFSKAKSPRATSPRLAEAAAPVATATLAAAARQVKTVSIATTEVAQAPSTLPGREAVVPAMSLETLDRKALTPVFVAATATAVAAPAVSTAIARSTTPSHGFNAAEQIAGLALTSDNSDAANAHFAAVSSHDALTAPVFGSLLDKTVARLEPTTRPVSRAIEPLAQMPTPKEARRARLVALLSLPGYDDAADSTSTVSRSRERSLSHFNDQAMYDAISRLEMKNQHREAAIQF
jgi:hypothetical protein